MFRVLLGVMTALVLQGCAQIGHQEFYTQVAPTKYPGTEKTYVFEYSNVDLDDVYKLLFSDFLVIGRSSFNGPYEPPTDALNYAHSIGADVFISTAQFQGTRTSFVSMTTPTVSTTNVSGYAGGGSFYGTATTYGTKTPPIPITVNRYDQSGMYLRNVNKVIPLWERTEAQYTKTESNQLEGVWRNEGYVLTVYQSGQQLVGFVAEQPTTKERADWKPGQLKLVFGAASGAGVYLMGNKTPYPAQFAVNKFGHLEVKLVGTKNTFSFSR
ncbi:hypothetical protein ACQVRX_01545 [Ralstonia pseudosolanacearum]